jgi:hypothetical protein
VDTCFCTLVVGPRQEGHAQLLVESLRAFGGRFSGCPVWVLHASDCNPDQETWHQLRVQLDSLDTLSSDEAPYTTRSYIDGCELRPYWNTHCFAVDPAMGLLRAWREGFRAMVADSAFQAGPCRDVPHQVFLHQAVWSARPP